MTDNVDDTGLLLQLTQAALMTKERFLPCTKRVPVPETIPKHSTSDLQKAQRQYVQDITSHTSLTLIDRQSNHESDAETRGAQKNSQHVELALLHTRIIVLF